MTRIIAIAAVALGFIFIVAGVGCAVFASKAPLLWLLVAALLPIGALLLCASVAGTWVAIRQWMDE